MVLVMMVVVVVVVIIVPRWNSRAMLLCVRIESEGMRVERAGSNRSDWGEDTRGRSRRTRGGERAGRRDGEGSNVERELVLLRLVVLGIAMLAGRRRERWWLGRKNPILLLRLLALSEIRESIHI